MNQTSCEWLAYIYDVVGMALVEELITEQRAEWITSRAEYLASKNDVMGLSGLLQHVN